MGLTATDTQSTGGLAGAQRTPSWIGQLQWSVRRVLLAVSEGRTCPPTGNGWTYPKM